MLNPNNAFKGKSVRMMTESQRVIIERQCKKHGISLIALTTKTLGKRKKTKDLTHLDAARCIAKGSVWENLRRAGDVPL